MTNLERYKKLKKLADGMKNKKASMVQQMIELLSIEPEAKSEELCLVFRNNSISGVKTARALALKELQRREILKGLKD